MTLHDRARAYLERFPPAVDYVPPTLAEIQESRPVDGDAEGRSPRIPLHEITDTEIAGVPVRVFRPAPGDLPVVVYIHGGGFVFGSADVDDPMCRDLGRPDGRPGDLGRLPAGPGAPVPGRRRRLLGAWSRRSSRITRRSRSWARARRQPRHRLRRPRARRGPAAHPPDAHLSVYGDAHRHQRLPRPRPLQPGDRPRGLALRPVRRHRPTPPTPRFAPALLKDKEGLAPATVITAEHDPLTAECERYAGGTPRGVPPLRRLPARLLRPARLLPRGGRGQADSPPTASGPRSRTSGAARAPACAR